MLITPEIKTLVEHIETAPNSSDGLIASLIQKLNAACELPENKQRYADGQNLRDSNEPYPMDDEGYAVAYDPLENEATFIRAWQQHGVVVGKSILSSAQCEETIAGIKARFKEISKGICDLDREDTWQNMPRDENGTPFLSRGFLEIYHDNMLATIRQNVRAYIHHVLIWNRTDLWTSFDRVGVKLPHHAEAGGLPLHVDQNPNVHPDFKTIQGVLALTIPTAKPPAMPEEP